MSGASSLAVAELWMVTLALAVLHMTPSQSPGDRVSSWQGAWEQSRKEAQTLDQEGDLELSLHLQPHLSLWFNPDTKAPAGNKAESRVVGPLESGDKPQDKHLHRVGSLSNCASCPWGSSFPVKR